MWQCISFHEKSVAKISHQRLKSTFSIVIYHKPSETLPTITAARATRKRYVHKKLDHPSQSSIEKAPSHNKAFHFARPPVLASDKPILPPPPACRVSTVCSAIAKCDFVRSTWFCLSKQDLFGNGRSQSESSSCRVLLTNTVT